MIGVNGWYSANWAGFVAETADASAYRDAVSRYAEADEDRLRRLALEFSASARG